MSTEATIIFIYINEAESKLIKIKTQAHAAISKLIIEIVSKKHNISDESHSNWLALILMLEIVSGNCLETQQNK